MKLSLRPLFQKWFFSYQTTGYGRYRTYSAAGVKHAFSEYWYSISPRQRFSSVVFSYPEIVEWPVEIQLSTQETGQNAYVVVAKILNNKDTNKG